MAAELQVGLGRRWAHLLWISVADPHTALIQDHQASDAHEQGWLPGSRGHDLLRVACPEQLAPFLLCLNITEVWV